MISFLACKKQWKEYKLFFIDFTFWGSNTLQFCFCAITERKVDIFPTYHWAQSFIYTKKKGKKERKWWEIGLYTFLYVNSNIFLLYFC